MSKTSEDAPRFVERGAKIMVWISGSALILMSFVITAETLVRKFAGFSLGGVHEFSSYLFAICSAWAFGWALMQGAHIRISVLREKCSPRAKAVLDVLAWAAFLLVFVAISYRAIELAWESYVTNARSPTPSRTQLYIPQALWALGLASAVIIALHLGIQAVRERSTRVFAPADEVEAELEHLK
ncbi:TRAP transporter small permease [Pseudaminobacter arsenicus]|uniref:TRAP transporter small permease protein n=1 Tax=Borborobacter arsenicus TaxID=1851146 RepID=A0A432V343_9HYPH|nr:TRAP transporter small permease [Pseudaminobacter arsenicus]RUM96624.1 TRAP transporter small permease [Pseudaminobacter arsenicus]